MSTPSGCAPRPSTGSPRLDRDVISTLAPTGSRLGDALNAVAAAALAHRARLAPHVPIWDLVAAVTRWRLLPLPGD